MPRKLQIVLVAALLAGCASVPNVTIQPPQRLLCPAIAPSLPCSVPPDERPETLADLRSAYLVAKKDGEDCQQLAETWAAWWKACSEKKDE